MKPYLLILALVLGGCNLREHPRRIHIIQGVLFADKSYVGDFIDVEFQEGNWVYGRLYRWENDKSYGIENGQKIKINLLDYVWREVKP